jgi:hypothetical protein
MPVKRVQRAILRNDDELYSEVLRKRGVSYIDQYATPILNHPNAQQISSLRRISHVWKMGDRFYKLADKYYGDSRYWWVIAWYNQVPTESHIETGQVLRIPTPLNKILALLREG